MTAGLRVGLGLVITVPLYYLLAMRQVARRPAAAREPARN